MSNSPRGRKELDKIKQLTLAKEQKQNNYILSDSKFYFNQIKPQSIIVR